MPVYNRTYWPPNTYGFAENLRHFGPLISVEIALPQALAQHLAATNQPVPAPIAGMALIDTGASITSVDNSVFQSLGVQPVGTAMVGAASGPSQQYIYPASISFPATMLVGLAFNQVLSCNLAGQPTGMPSPLIALVGRDLLRHFVFIFNGPMGLITITH
jgi:hypothetical protein